jgi:hypothetical protein
MLVYFFKTTNETVWHTTDDITCAHCNIKRFYDVDEIRTIETWLHSHIAEYDKILEERTNIKNGDCTISFKFYNDEDEAFFRILTSNGIEI